MNSLLLPVFISYRSCGEKLININALKLFKWDNILNFKAMPANITKKITIVGAP